MKKIQVYNSTIFKKFILGEDYLKISNQAYPLKSCVLIRNNKFIAPINYQKEKIIYFLDTNKIYLGSNKNIIHRLVISGQQLFYGELNLDNLQNSELDALPLHRIFKSMLLESMFNWLERFVRCLMEHFKEREYEKQTFLRLEVIRNRFAEIVQSLEFIAQAILSYKKSTHDNDHAGSLAIHHMLITAHILARLAGGRAFLAGNIVSLLSLFQGIQNLYFFSEVVHADE